jgi:hypothetical protein
MSCTTLPAAKFTPALIENESIDTRKIIEQAVSLLMEARSIPLADSVFSKSSQLIIDRVANRDSHGNLLNGRTTEPADTFTLLSKNNECYLRHNQTKQTVILDSITCTVE